MTSQFLQKENSSTGVKICGLQDEDCVEVAVGAGANAIGFVFVDHSPRCLTREFAEQLKLQLPEDVEAVAVLQDHPDLESFSDWDGWLQLCGNETEDELSNISQPIIKAMKWDKEKFLHWESNENVHAILVDGSTGGMGTMFDPLELIEVLPSLQTPVILAGGLTPKNVASLIRQVKPAAVDVSSGVESSRGVKDPSLICEFIEEIRKID